MEPRDPSQTVEAVRDVATRIACDLGLELVDLSFRGAGRQWLLRVEIDRPGPAGVGINDCQRVSVALSAALDEEDLIDHSYTLEVSSPGIDRPIRTPDDVRRNAGRRVTAETVTPVGGRRSFRGVLLGLEGEEFRLMEEEGTEVRIPFKEISRARQDPSF